MVKKPYSALLRKTVSELTSSFFFFYVSTLVPDTGKQTRLLAKQMTKICGHNSHLPESLFNVRPVPFLIFRARA